MNYKYKEINILSLLLLLLFLFYITNIILFYFILLFENYPIFKLKFLSILSPFTLRIMVVMV